VHSDDLIIAVDRKTVRRSHRRRKSRPALHLVRAWATEAGIALGQVATEVKSNEITAIPGLLHQLELQGTVVTRDAMSCQTQLVEQTISQQGDYMLPLKDNQDALSEAGRDYFSVAQAHDFQDVDYTYHEQLDTSHDTLRNAVVGLGGFEHLTSATAVGGAAQHYQGGK